MSRILLVDDSPHAQRMGERILSDEGYEVVTVSNADAALVRMEDVDPDLVLADAVMPGRTGYDICQYLKMSPRHRHVRVLLTAGVTETLDEAQAYLDHWEQRWADTRIHVTTKRQVAAMFAEEKPTLLPLPLEQVDACTPTTAEKKKSAWMFSSRNNESSLIPRIPLSGWWARSAWLRS